MVQKRQFISTVVGRSVVVAAVGGGFLFLLDRDDLDDL